MTLIHSCAKYQRWETSLINSLKKDKDTTNYKNNPLYIYIVSSAFTNDPSVTSLHLYYHESRSWKELNIEKKIWSQIIQRSKWSLCWLALKITGTERLMSAYLLNYTVSTQRITGFIRFTICLSRCRLLSSEFTILIELWNNDIWVWGRDG